MKKVLLLITCSLLLLAESIYAQQGYNIKVTVPSMAGKNLILANYFEGKVYAVDTAHLNASGVGAFHKDKKLARGMYLLLFSPSNYFDLLIGDSQHFSIITDTLKVLENMRIEGAPENLAFLDFQRFMVSQNQKTRQIRENFEKNPDKESEATRKKYSDQFDAADREVRSYIANLNKQYPGSALATFSRFTLSPEIPDFAKEVPEGTPDRETEIQRRAYFYSKNHYWDNTNFKDSTLIRTPIFKSKLDDFFNKMILQHPDSVFKESVNIIERSRGCKAMFRYLVSYCFNFSLENKIMGMDAAFVYIAKKYYLTGQTPWVDKENLEKIEREVILTQYNLIGMKAQELKLPTLDGDWVSLYETEAPFTLLLFWESDCGHCKKQVPLIKKQLLDKYKPYGFKVFAVHTQNEKDKWEKFVTEHDLFDFINCSDPHNQTNFRVYYHIESTPVIYLLDKDKKIIAKKLDIEQLDDLLKREYKRQGINIK
ncbi:MAG: DUF5106 domain-containing protein [Odoribacter sp.]|nr:DUF5106 domain-containing protein [Odoribacter sp.]